MTATPRAVLNWTAVMISGALLGILAGAMYALAYHEIPDKNHDLMVVVVTAITTNVGTMIAFYFGSSAQSKQQSDTNSQLASAVNTALATDPVKAPEKTVSINPGQTAEVKATEQP